MDIADVFLLKVMLASLELVRCWPGACSFYSMALLALGWNCSSSACPEDRGSGVLREQGVCWCLRGAGGGVLDPLALSEVVGLPEIMLRHALAALYRISWRCLRFSSSTWGVFQFLDKVVFMPVACRQCLGSDVQKTVVCRSCSSWTKWTSQLLLRQVHLGLKEQKTLEVPQLPCLSMSAGAVHRRLWTSL